MSRILILSSWVSVGHVGLSAAVPALQALGHRVTQLPSCTLSNHPGWPHCAGGPVPPDRLRDMIDAIDENGWLGEHDAMLTGYLPTGHHVGVACELVERMRDAAPGLRVVVDPVLGDHPKGLYLDPGAAAALRDRLAPMADVLTPNRFELGWLTGWPVETPAQVEAAARGLAEEAPGCRVLVTSPPFTGETGVLEVSEEAVRQFRTPLFEDVPHGAGDVLAALVAAGLPAGAALGHVAALAAASAGAGHLDIVGAAERWTSAPAVPDEPLQAEG